MIKLSWVTLVTWINGGMDQRVTWFNQWMIQWTVGFV